jgi:hypothetical protein
MSDIAGTYTIVLNNAGKIISVTHNGKLMVKHVIDVDEEENNLPKLETHSLADVLGHGCVGFGALHESATDDECRWRFGTWW